MHRILALSLPAMLAVSPLHAQDSILGRATPWELLGEDYQLTAEVAVDKIGNVFFTDSKTSRILKIDVAGKIATWKENSGGAHGVAFGPDGRLYAAQHDRKRIVVYAGDGSESVAAEGTQSHHLAVDSRSRIYFTVPPAHQVWIADTAGQKRVVYDALQFPRGVRPSPDDSRLIVNDPPKNEVWSFRIQPDGSLTGGRRFGQLKTSGQPPESDAGGMAFDAEGFLYVATKSGVQILDRSGRVVEVVSTPGTEGVNNVFFAGPDLQWLYVTAWDKIYRRPVKRRGARLGSNTKRPGVSGTRLAERRKQGDRP
jgi:sugar lactone lactonase YvrE